MHQFLKLIRHLSMDEQIDFVLDYREKTMEKLKVFENIIQFAKKRGKEVELTKEFKLEYIRLLCTFKKHLVFKEVSTGLYPPQETLEIVKEYGIELAKIYLLGKSGEFDAAIPMIQRRIKKILKSLIIGLRYQDSPKRTRLLHKLEFEINLAIQMARETLNSNKVKSQLLKKIEFV